MRKFIRFASLLLCAAVFLFGILCVRVVTMGDAYHFYLRSFGQAPDRGDTILVNNGNSTYTIMSVVGTEEDSKAAAQYIQEHVDELTADVITSNAWQLPATEGFSAECFYAVPIWENGTSFIISVPEMVTSDTYWGDLIWTLDLPDTK